MIEDILSHFKSVKKSGDQWRAKCPAHVTHNRSLVISFGEKRILFYCYAGCRDEDILDAAGLTWQDVWYREDGNVSVDVRRRMVRASDQKPWMSREEIEHQHDFGTMSEGEYRERLTVWNGRRTLVEFDDAGEVVAYDLLPYKRVRQGEQQGHRTSASGGNTARGDEPFEASRPAAQ